MKIDAASILSAIIFFTIAFLVDNHYSNITSDKFLAKFNELAQILNGKVQKIGSFYSEVELEGKWKGHKIKIISQRDGRYFDFELTFFVATEKRPSFTLYIERRNLAQKMTDMSSPEVKTGDIQFDRNYSIISPLPSEERILALSYIKREQTRKIINDFFKNGLDYEANHNSLEIIDSGIKLQKVSGSTVLLENLNKEKFIETLNNLISIIPVDEPTEIRDGS